MKIEIIILNNEEIYFSIKGINIAFANAVRRIIIAEVFTFAINDVIIIKNDSIMYADYISQRLGLLPINSNNRSLISIMPIECNCENHRCPHCCIILEVEVTSDTHKKRIFLKDLNLKENHLALFTRDAFDIPLFVLNQNESFKAKLYITKGIGHQNARWMPSSVCIAKPYPKITIQDHDLPKAMVDKLINTCPKKLFLLDKQNKIEIKNPDQCIYCNACVEFLEEEKLPAIIKIEPNENEFIFHIESVGTMSPDLIFSEAIKILKQKVNELNECFL